MLLCCGYASTISTTAIYLLQHDSDESTLYLASVILVNHIGWLMSPGSSRAHLYHFPRTAIADVCHIAAQLLDDCVDLTQILLLTR